MSERTGPAPYGSSTPYGDAVPSPGHRPVGPVPAAPATVPMSPAPPGPPGSQPGRPSPPGPTSPVFPVADHGLPAGGVGGGSAGGRHAGPVPGAEPRPSVQAPAPAPSPGAPSPGAGRPDGTDAFAPPPGVEWARVSPRLAWYRRVAVLLTAIPVMVVATFLAARAFGLGGGVVAMAVVVAGCVLGWVLAELNYRSWGYAERSDDLLVTHGVAVRRLVVVPYGRMQFVDVTANMLEQSLGIATVRLYTAAATTDARIPGLPAPEAARLRDRLAERSEARSMGL